MSLAALNAAPASAQWVRQQVDMAANSGWSLSLAIDSSGSAHAAYFTTNPNGDYRTARQTPSGWQPGPILDSAMAFALDDNDDKFFLNQEAPNYYPHFNIQLDNGLVLKQQLASTSVSQSAFLRFDSLNRPQIGYVDITAQQLKHAFWNGASWTTRTVASGAEFQYGNSSFIAALDSANGVHFSWRNQAGAMRYARPNGTTWQTSTPFSTLDARPYDMIVDDAGQVHLAFDVSTGNVHTGGLFYGLRSGSTWTNSRVTGLDNFGAGRSQIVVDDQNQPHIFTYDSTFSGPDQLKHVFRENSAWANEIVDSYTANVSGPESIEALADEQGFHVLYSTGLKNIHYAFLSTAEPTGPADFNGDHLTDDADRAVWAAAFGIAQGATRAQGDANGDGAVNGLDFLVWQQLLGSSTANVGVAASNVPEPLAFHLLALAGSVLLSVRRRRLWA